MDSEESYKYDRENESSIHDIDEFDLISSNKFVGREEQAKIRREKDKLRARERRKCENEEAKKERREKCRLSQAQRRKDETHEQREHRLAVDRERAKRRRMKESEDEKQQRLEMNRIRTSIRRRGTVDNAMDAHKIFNDDPEVKDLLTISGNRVVQLDNPEDSTRITIGVVNESDEAAFYKLVSFRKESDEQKQIRLERGRQYAAKRRSQETPEQRQKRLERERNSVRRRRQKQNHATTSRSESMDYSLDGISEDNDNEIFVDSLDIQQSVQHYSSASPSLISPLPQTSENGEKSEAEEEQENNLYSEENEQPPASTSADAALAGINNYLLGNGPLSMPSFSASDVSSFLDFSQIYSHVLHPSTSISDNWVTPTENVLKDKCDMYLMQNLGLDTSASPSNSIFNNIPQPQPLQPSNNFFHNSAPNDDLSNPMTIGDLLRNLSNNQQTIENTFNPSPFGSHSLLGTAGLGICASPSSNVFNSFDARIDSLLGIGGGGAQNSNNYNFAPTSVSGLPSVSAEADECNNMDNNDALNVSSGPASNLERIFENTHVQITEGDSRTKNLIMDSPQIQRQQSITHFDKIVQYSFNSLILQLESTMDDFHQDGANFDSCQLSPCPDMSIIPNSGLHLVVSSFLIETQFHRLRNYYYSSIDRLLKTREYLDGSKIFGGNDDDRCAWSEMYDTMRSIHVEISKILWEKGKSETADTILFNRIERAELEIKRVQSRRGYPSIDRNLTFLDYAMIELLDFLDHIAQITWIVFPSLAQERAIIHASSGYRLYRHK